MSNSPRPAHKVLLIGWDAADWKLINPLLDAGQMPHLAQLVERGVIGNIATLQPCLSPILWTSIATGKTADKHGITGFVEPLPDNSGLRLASSTSRKTKALWNILGQRGLKSNIVNWYASHPAEPIDGVCVSNQFADGAPSPLPGGRSPWPLTPGSVHPPELAQSVAELRVHPAEIRPGDLAVFVPQLAQIDLAQDPRPRQLAEALAKCASVHAVATAAMESEPWDFTAVFYETLDAAGHVFMPYHPPRMEHVPPREFELYQNVMSELYRFHDQMLGRLIELAGADATVILVSDHGFHGDHLRPKTLSQSDSPEALAAAWHRPYGVFVMAGPRVKRDERVYGATLLDVAPTVLALFGLPIGKDMDGKPLVQALDGPSRIDRIESWDADTGGNAGMHPPDLRQDPFESASAVQHLVDLGYLPAAAATADARRAVEIATAESQFNLAVVHLHHRRPEQARRILEALVARYPDQPRYQLPLAKAYAELGDHARSYEILEMLESRGLRSADGDLMLATALFNLGRPEAALERILDAERRGPPSANMYYLIGELHVAQRRWGDAQQAFGRAVEQDPDHAQAHHGMAVALLNLGQHERSAEHALRAVGLLHYYPVAHYHLGMALAGMGETARAAKAMEVAVGLAPKFPEAHQRLAQLYTQLGDVPRAMRHRRLADLPADPTSAMKIE